METNVNALLKKNEPQRKKLKKTLVVEVKNEEKENYIKNKSSFFDPSLSSLRKSLNLRKRLLLLSLEGSKMKI